MLDQSVRLAHLLVKLRWFLSEEKELGVSLVLCGKRSTGFRAGNSCARSGEGFVLKRLCLLVETFVLR